jgi:hypothetical protein
MTFTTPPVVPVGVKTVVLDGPAATVPMFPRSTFQPALIGWPSSVAVYVTVGACWPIGTVSVCISLGWTSRVCVDPVPVELVNSPPPDPSPPDPSPPAPAPPAFCAPAPAVPELPSPPPHAASVKPPARETHRMPVRSEGTREAIEPC